MRLRSKTALQRSALPSCINGRWIDQRPDGRVQAHVRCNGVDRDLGVFVSPAEANDAVLFALRSQNHG